MSASLSTDTRIEVRYSRGSSDSSGKGFGGEEKSGATGEGEGEAEAGDCCLRGPCFLA